MAASHTKIGVSTWKKKKVPPTPKLLMVCLDDMIWAFEFRFW